MASNPFRFVRSDLADRYADILIGEGPFDYRSGMFLAAPRRTGKSTFLREDLVPALDARGVLTIYVDLWSDRDRDPAALIRAALSEATVRASGWVRRFAGRIQAKSISVPGLAKLDFERVGTADGPTMTEALASLSARAKSDVALIVDEAQHTLSTTDGLNAMFALKAARDAFNQNLKADGARLILVFTGSDRNKLANLVLKRDQPFFGARIDDFPLLGPDYCAAYADWINARLSADQQLDADAVFQAFKIVGHRPEFLIEVIQNAIVGAGPASVIEEAQARRARLLAEYEGDFNARPPLQQALLRLLAQDRTSFQPFSNATLALLGAEVSVSSVQTALESLRAANLIWSPARGAYAIEDQDMEDWLVGTRGQG